MHSLPFDLYRGEASHLAVGMPSVYPIKFRNQRTDD